MTPLTMLIAILSAAAVFSACTTRKDEAANRAEIERELTAIEEAWVAAANAGDTDFLKRNLAEDFVHNFDGVVETRSQEIEGWIPFSSGSAATGHIHVNVLNANAAVVTGRDVYKGVTWKHKDGSVTALSGEIVWTDTFVRRDGRWQCVASHETTLRNWMVDPQVIDMERRWTEAAFKNDVEFLREFEADDYTFTDQFGHVSGKPHDLEDAERGAASVASWEWPERRVVPVGRDAAVGTGLFIVKGARYTNKEGKVDDWSGQYRYTDVFQKRDGRWLVVASQITKVRSP